MNTPRPIGPKDRKVGYIPELRESTNETARVARNNLLVFLVVGLYMTLLSVQHNDLLLATEGHLAIPLMEIGVPVTAFYALGPLAFFILHLNLFLRLGRLTDVVTSLERKLEQLHPAHKRVTEAELVFPLDFLQLLLHRHPIAQEQRGASSRGTGRFLQDWHQHRATLIPLFLIVSTPLFVLPLVLLGWMHWRFLRYQSEAVTLTHQFLITLDVLLQIAFLLKLQRAKRSSRRTASKAALLLAAALVGLAYGAAIVVTWWVAVVPGSSIEEHRPFSYAAKQVTKEIFNDWWEPHNC